MPRFWSLQGWGGLCRFKQRSFIETPFALHGFLSRQPTGLFKHILPRRDLGRPVRHVKQNEAFGKLAAEVMSHSEGRLRIEYNIVDNSVEFWWTFEIYVHQFGGCSPFKMHSKMSNSRNPIWWTVPNTH